MYNEKTRERGQRVNGPDVMNVIKSSTLPDAHAFVEGNRLHIFLPFL